jgi:hypothetical protein
MHRSRTGAGSGTGTLDGYVEITRAGDEGPVTCALTCHRVLCTGNEACGKTYLLQRSSGMH